MDRFRDVLFNSVRQPLGGPVPYCLRNSGSLPDTDCHSGMRIVKLRWFSVKQAVAYILFGTGAAAERSLLLE